MVLAADPIRFISVLMISAALVAGGGVLCGTAAEDRVDVRQPERQLDDRAQQRQREKAQPSLGVAARPDAVGVAGAGARFVLKSINIEGASALSRTELAESYRAYLGRSVSEADLTEIANAITTLYQTAGYLLSRAFIPPQDIVGGLVRVKVVEGRIANVNFQGGQVAKFGLEQLAEPLSREHPLTRRTFERQLLLINDTPGVQVEDTVLRELGTASGRFELTVVIKTWHGWGHLTIDNRGSQDVGPLQAFATAAAHSVLIPGGTVAIDTSTVPDETRELSFGRLSVEQPIGDSGFRFGFAASSSRLRPSGIRRLRNTRVRTDNFALKGTVVSYRSQETSLWLTVEGGTRLEEERDDTGLAYRDRIRALSFLADLQVLDPLGGMNFITLNLRRGFSVFGASRAGDQNLSRSDGSGEFTKFYTSYYRNQTLRKNWSLALAAQAQLSADALLSSEEFYLGGASIGRAFESGAISGDSGLGGVAELRYEMKPETSFLKSWMVYGFVDGGAVWNRNSTATSPLALASFGGGARIEFAREIRMEFELAKPFQDHTWAEDGRKTRASFMVSHSIKF